MEEDRTKVKLRVSDTGGSSGELKEAGRQVTVSMRVV